LAEVLIVLHRQRSLVLLGPNQDVREYFLTGLSIYGTTHDCIEAVDTDPDIYADRSGTETYELRRRLEAIAAVRTPQFLGVRETCMKALRSGIATAESHINSP
jgi:hypothetical protein